MSYSRDFESVRVQDDGTTLRVNATSRDEHGKATTEDPATSFLVALAKAPHGGPCRVSGMVEGGVDGAWAAFFLDAAQDYRDNPDLYVIGIANVAEGSPPEMWLEPHTIRTRAGEPFPGAGHPA
jgi:hypothetical protein